MIKPATKKKRKLKTREYNLLNVYNERDNVDQSEKVLKRRGGGGGETGRNLDKINNIEVNQDIESEDDEEITEDEAFDDADENNFGLFFQKSDSNFDDKTKSKNKAVHTSKVNKSQEDFENGQDALKEGGDIDLNEEEEQQEVLEEDIDESEYMDISELLNEPRVTITKTNALKKIDLLNPAQSDSDSPEFYSGDEDSDAGDDTAVHDLSMLLQNNTTKRKRLQERSEIVEESEFMLGVKDFGRKRVQLNDLVSGVREETSFGALKKQLGFLKKSDGAVDKPLAPRIQDKLNRKAAKIETDKSVSKWIPLVKANREADVLEFRNNEPHAMNVTSASLVSKFEPFTQMEQEINEVLQKSGVIQRKELENEELELSKLSHEAMLERRLELQKMRSVMFYQEQKQKKISKIKSKTYRKISNKNNGKEGLEIGELEKIDPERAQEERDRLDFERAKERMTLKHNNTGKWARKMLGRQDGTGSETQKALMEQLRQGERLRQKIKGGDSDESEYNSDEEVTEKALRDLSKLKDQIDNDGDVPTTGVFAMKFMQRGYEKQKIASKQAIVEAEEEFQAFDSSDVESSKPQLVAESTNGRYVIAHQPSTKMAREVSEFENVAQSYIKTSGPISAHSNLFNVESFGNVEEIIEKTYRGDANKNDNVYQKPNAETRVKDSDATVATDTPIPVVVKSKKIKVVRERPEAVDSNKPNPWIENVDDTLVKKSIQGVHKKYERVNKTQNAVNKLAIERQKLLKSSEQENVEVLLPKPTIVVSHESEHSGDELDSKVIMQMAFANDDIEAEFQKEKEEFANIETGKSIETDLPGWGSWGGQGVKTKLRTKVIQKAGGIDLSKRKDRNLKHVIINEKRQKKVIVINQAIKYMQPKLPHGFENRLQYEQVIAMPVGKEWNTQGSHNKLVQARIQTKIGTIIQPMKYLPKR